MTFPNSKAFSLLELSTLFQFLLTGFNPGDEKAAARLTDWWDHQPAPEPPMDLSRRIAAITADFEHMSFYLLGPSGKYIQSTLDFMEKNGATTRERERLIEAGKRMEPDTLGSWMEIAPKAVDGGWLFQTETTVDQAMPCVDPSEEKTLFAQWAREFGVEDVWQIRRSIAEPQPMTELCLFLPETGDPQATQKITDELFTRLGLTPFDPAIGRTLFERSPSTTIGLVIAFIAGGVSRLGITVHKPQMEQVLLLCSLHKTYSDEKLAQWEGTLGAQGPDLFTFSKKGAGFSSECYYRFRNVTGKVSQ